MSTQTTGVLVGVDGSACAEAALRWAAADAAARNVPLTIAYAVDLPRLADVPLSAELVAAAERAGRLMVDAAAATARDQAAVPVVETVVVTGDPAASLLGLAGGAAEVVVGSHGHGAVSSLLLGSVSAKVAEHSPVPAVVVRGGTATADRVLVGIDGSPRSEAALEQAFAHADRHGLALTALHVYTLGAFVYPVMPYPVPPYPIAEELARLRQDAVRQAKDQLQPWTEKYPDVPVRVDVVEGAAAYKIVEATRTAALVVVGTRGHGGLAGMLLGSVSQAVTRHAHCPVLVAR